MRQLKHHEQKLLKKVNFLAWKNEHNQRELQVSPFCHLRLYTSRQAGERWHLWLCTSRTGVGQQQQGSEAGRLAGCWGPLPWVNCPRGST
jgi:hypothetical protein